ncbi:MAG: methyltransferase domain-containing protein [Ruminococcaceae bacterium]|nr:methyltransferase domain-containing protein [Oscillospiraceae bacterium]
MDLKQRVQSMHDFFNERVDGYDEKHAPLMQSKKQLINALPQGVCRVLDLGAGTGLELFYLFERFPNAAVTAIDVSDLMLERLKSRPFGNRVDCRLGDFFELPFGDNYDAVISTSALHHFTPADKLRLFEKILRALRPGGIFVNSDYYAESAEAQEASFIELEENPNNRSHIDTPLTLSAERSLLEQAGFVDLSQTPVADQHYAVSVGYRQA